MTYTTTYQEPLQRTRLGIPYRTVLSCQSDRGPLFTRYFLCATRWFAIYVHHLHTSDEDRALHDHPWSFVTFLLSGGYFEHTPEGRHWRRRFSLLYRPAEWLHRLELVQPTWTVLIHFRRRRLWGFRFADGRWEEWRAYHANWCG